MGDDAARARSAASGPLKSCIVRGTRICRSYRLSASRLAARRCVSSTNSDFAVEFVLGQFTRVRLKLLGDGVCARFKPWILHLSAVCEHRFVEGNLVLVHLGFQLDDRTV